MGEVPSGSFSQGQYALGKGLRNARLLRRNRREGGFAWVRRMPVPEKQQTFWKRARILIGDRRRYLFLLVAFLSEIGLSVFDNYLCVMEETMLARG
jgi:hypothetical protein